jgi:MFS family permease
MTVAGLLGFLAPIPLGRHADRHGPREVYRLLLILEAIATLGFAFCSATWQVVVIASARRLLTTPGSGPRPSPAHCGSNRVHRLTRAFVGRTTHGISRAVIRFVAPAAPV